MKKNVLIIVAHRDDETIGCGATIAKLSKNNYNIFAISMTDGVSSRKGFNNIQIKKRYINSINVSKILKFKWLDHFSGQFKDNNMGSESLLDVVKLIEKAKKEVNPEIVFTHFSEDLNIDHQIVANATMTAFRPKDNDNCKMILSFEIPSSTDYASYKKIIFRPNYYVNIEHFWKQKLKALKAYKNELMKYPNSRSLKGLENLAKLRGNQVGFKMAESFQILRFLEK
jgi:LmbE family N-acetylglucosaminyl deacetylase